MWSYLRQYHPKKSDTLAVQVIEEGRRAYEQRDEAWNVQLKLMLSNVCSGYPGGSTNTCEQRRNER